MLSVAEQHRREVFHRLHDVRPVVDSRHIGVLPGVGHGHFAFPGPDDFTSMCIPTLDCPGQGLKLWYQRRFDSNVTRMSGDSMLVRLAT